MKGKKKIYLDFLQVKVKLTLIRSRFCSIKDMDVPSAFFFNLEKKSFQQKQLCLIKHSSYDQWDRCGEGEQLQVPLCKHLRGPDLDCTHSNTG